MDPQRKNSIIALLIITLAMLLMGILEALALPNSFREEAQVITAKALKYRDGIVILRDQKTNAEWVFGNPRLRDQYFSPGSLMKLITAEAAQGLGVHQKYHCQGHELTQGQRRTCWTARGHGPLELPEALGKSCNLYFARLARKLGWTPWLQTLKSYDFSGAKDLQTRAPTHLRDFMDLSIGDSVLFHVTPGEISEFWNQYVRKLPRKDFTGIAQGLLRAQSQGTASRLGNHTGVYAKTGTADAGQKAYKTHAWFLGAFPAPQPRFTLLIFLKNAHGFREPTALADQIIRLSEQAHEDHL